MFDGLIKISDKPPVQMIERQRNELATTTTNTRKENVIALGYVRITDREMSTISHRLNSLSSTLLYYYFLAVVLSAIANSCQNI